MCFLALAQQKIMEYQMKNKICSILLLILCFRSNAVFAEMPHAPPINDRSSSLPSSMPTSDDVQRIPVPKDFNAPKGAFVLTGGRLFDGTGAPARPATIVVQGKSIITILAPGDHNWPADAKIYDVAGKTVMPGLIDLHTHLTYGGWPTENHSVGENYGASSGGEETLRAAARMSIYLQAGVTSVRDVASTGDIPFVLKRWQSEGRLSGPRVFAAGQLITGTGGHGDEPNAAPLNPNSSIRLASGPDGWREAVRIQFRNGADLIKLASHYSQAEIDAAVEEAHSLGLPVTVDAETIYIDRAIAAGVDSIEHPLPRSDAAIALMGKRGIASVPTLIPYRIISRVSGGYFMSSSRRFALNEITIVDMAKKLRRAGVKLGVGTDLVADWINYMPGAYIDELRSFTEIGYTRSEALVAATKTSAEILKMKDRLGTISEGMLADIIVIDGNPDQDLNALKKVSMVFVNGRLMLKDGQVQTPLHSEVPLPVPH
jgi:imidazolonepropionase-like amidohydrolase